MNPLWPADVPLWRKLLCMLLMPGTVVAVFVFWLAYFQLWLCYRLSCLADGRPNRTPLPYWLGLSTDWSSP